MLGAARPATFIMTRDSDRARRFYKDVLGLTHIRQDGFADVFDTGGATLRVTEIPEWTAGSHPALNTTRPPSRMNVRSRPGA